MDFLIAVLSSVSQYGVMPAIILLGVFVLMISRKVDEIKKASDDGKTEISKQFEAVKTSINASLKELEQRIEKRMEGHDAELKELSRRITCLEQDALMRDEHYRDISGWRTEINRLQDLIIKHLET